MVRLAPAMISDTTVIAWVAFNCDFIRLNCSASTTGAAGVSSLRSRVTNWSNNRRASASGDSSREIHALTTGRAASHRLWSG